MRLTLSTLLLSLLAPAAHAQLFGSGIVYDPTQSTHAIEQIRQGVQEIQHIEQIYTTALETRDEIIAAYNLAYQMTRMPQGLYQRYKSDFAPWTNLSAPNTYGNTQVWIDALDFGNPSRATAAYNNAVIQAQSYPAGAMSLQDADTQAVIKNQYGSTEIGQATLASSLSTIGTIRSDSEGFAQKLANLESDTYSDDPNQQTSNALLGKINTATLLQIHSQQDANQLLTAVAQQQALDEKEKLDQRNRLINQSIYFEQNFSNTMRNLTGGVSDALHNISLTPSGR
jgi:hypothetical protein